MQREVTTLKLQPSKPNEQNAKNKIKIKPHFDKDNTALNEKLNLEHTCKEVTLRSSSDMYCSFLTRDLCADCLFAKILTNKSNY